MKSHAVVIMVLAAVEVAAMGGCSSGGGKDGGPSAAGTSSSATATPGSEPSQPPTFVESDTCRAKMAPLIDIMLANDVDNLTYSTFHDRFEELDSKMKNALLACSDDVSRPATRVVYEYAVANAAWGFCTGDKCATALIKKALVKGTTLAYKVRAQVEETT